MCLLDIVLFTARPKLRFVGYSVSIQRSKIENRQTDYDLASSPTARLSSRQTEDNAISPVRLYKSGRLKKKGRGGTGIGRPKSEWPRRTNSLF